jgi:CheY-like chemotaxis protein
MNGGEEDVLRLPAVLDLAASEDFLGTVLQQLETSKAVCLDASGVETLTLPCIQVILAALATHRVLIANPSEAFTSAFQDLALDWRAGGEPDGAIESADAAVDDQDEPAPVVAVPAAPSEMVSAPRLVPAPEPVPESDPPPPPISAPLVESTSQPSSLQPAPAAAPVEAADDALADAAPVGGAQSDEPNCSQSSEMNGASMAKRILTIDDSKTMRDMLMLTLAEAGFEVLQAVDGQDGLDVLGDERVDVIITDINMPKMDGYGVIRNLRKNPIHKRTPILVLTTESDTEKRIIAREAGATGWMVKPFDPDRLIATIRKVSP